MTRPSACDLSWGAGAMTSIEKTRWDSLMTAEVEELSLEDKAGGTRPHPTHAVLVASASRSLPRNHCLERADGSAIGPTSGFVESLKGVAISSDAFFPFRDSIDVASQHGVEW